MALTVSPSIRGEPAEGSLASSRCGDIENRRCYVHIPGSNRAPNPRRAKRPVDPSGLSEPPCPPGGQRIRCRRRIRACCPRRRSEAHRPDGDPEPSPDVAASCRSSCHRRGLPSATSLRRGVEVSPLRRCSRMCMMRLTRPGEVECHGERTTRTNLSRSACLARQQIRRQPQGGPGPENRRAPIRRAPSDRPAAPG